jgi:hypothetical protein
VKKIVLTMIAAAACAFALEPIATNSKMYVAPANGFENYVSAAIMNKGVPVTIVTDREQADYVIETAQETQKAGWAKILVKGDMRSSENASMRIVNARTGAVVYAYQYDNGSSFRGKQSSSESLAKWLKKYIEKSAK